MITTETVRICDIAIRTDIFLDEDLIAVLHPKKDRSIVEKPNGVLIAQFSKEVPYGQILDFIFNHFKYKNEHGKTYRTL